MLIACFALSGPFSISDTTTGRKFPSIPFNAYPFSVTVKLIICKDGFAKIAFNLPYSASSAVFALIPSAILAITRLEVFPSGRSVTISVIDSCGL